MRLKRWESPRRQGRNDKGKGGSASAGADRQRNCRSSPELARQIRKQQQRLRQKLKERSEETIQNRDMRKDDILPLFFG